jgi:hypothetical protein
MNEVVYLNVESSGWLFVGAVNFFNLSLHIPTLILLGAILFVGLRIRKIVKDKKK